MTALSRLFSEGFRVFFLAAGLWAVVAMLPWLAYLGGPVAGQGLGLPGTLAPQLWHGHEMIFGYGAAAMAGFFLTAVPNWTGAPGARHLFLGTAAALWLAGRGVVWAADTLPGPVVAAVSLAFLPLLGAKIAAQLIRRPKAANLMFLGLIALIWAAELRVQLDWLGLPGGDAQAGLRGGIFALVAMIAVLGGRVTPAFTRNALIRASLARSGSEPPAADLPRSRAPLERIAILGAIAAALGAVLALPDRIEGVALMIFGAAQLARMTGWQSRAVLGQPILAVLHLAMAMTGLGALAGGLALWGIGSEIGALHVTAIGGIGGMTLAMMSRAALGHTGRPLIAPRGVALGYALIPLAAGLRWAGALWPGLYTPAMLGAGLLWVLAFGLFVIALWPAFWRPRLPRAEG